MTRTSGTEGAGVASSSLVRGGALKRVPPLPTIRPLAERGGGGERRRPATELRTKTVHRARTCRPPSGVGFNRTRAGDGMRQQVKETSHEDARIAMRNAAKKHSFLVLFFEHVVADFGAQSQRECIPQAGATRPHGRVGGGVTQLQLPRAPVAPCAPRCHDWLRCSDWSPWRCMRPALRSTARPFCVGRGPRLPPRAKRALRAAPLPRRRAVNAPSPAPCRFSCRFSHRRAFSALLPAPRAVLRWPRRWTRRQRLPTPGRPLRRRPPPFLPPPPLPLRRRQTRHRRRRKWRRRNTRPRRRALPTPF